MMLICVVECARLCAVQLAAPVRLLCLPSSLIVSSGGHQASKHLWTPVVE